MSERLRRLACSICDYRKTHKKNFRHPLPDMLILSILARLCGCGTRKEIIKFGEHNLQLLQSVYQRTLRYSVEDTLPGMTADDEYHSVETGHGRIYERRCRVFYGVDRISGIDKFRGVCAVVEVTTHPTYKTTGKETSQTRYYITSLRGSARLMDYISRKHWGIENNLHWELDTLQGQDATKRKYPKAARNLDTIQKIVHAIIAYTARKKLPYEISSSKEKMKTQLKSLMTMASFNIGFALSMMAL